MRELVIRFGQNRSLVGIVCEAEERSQSQDATALVFINSGLVHRVGPNRIYVNAARKLASAGLLTMRFDLSGVGDSEPRTDSLPFEERSMLEIREAMNFLEKTSGVRQFILTGICSGADNAFDVASVDPRVIGIIPIDFYSYPSAGYLLDSYKQRLLSFRSWGKLLTGKSELWNAIKSKIGKTSAFQSNGLVSQGAGDWIQSSREKCEEKFRLLARRGTHLCLIYSGGSPAYYNYRAFFRDGLRSAEFEGKFQVVYFDSADHGFTTILHQDQLILKICEGVRGFMQEERTATD